MVSHPHVIPLHPRCGLLCTASDSYDSILYPHHHKACEILLVLEGLHEVQLEAGCITLSAGEMMLIRSNEIHSRRMIHKGRYLTIAFLPEESTAFTTPGPPVQTRRRISLCAYIMEADSIVGFSVEATRISGPPAALEARLTRSTA